jgi:transcriptional regulator with XRE-family HTH domain
MNVDRLKQLGLKQEDIASRLGISGGGVSLKVNGHRPWKREEIDVVLEMAREVDPEITYEQLFAGAEACA